jgi:hypothetical protein
MRDEYATGQETLAQIAPRFKVSYKLVERHAGRAARGWWEVVGGMVSGLQRRRLA